MICLTGFYLFTLPQVEKVDPRNTTRVPSPPKSCPRLCSGSSGTFRPGLLQKAESNKPETVKKAWQQAGRALVRAGEHVLIPLVGDSGDAGAGSSTSSKIGSSSGGGAVSTTTPSSTPTATQIAEDASLALKALDKNLFGAQGTGTE